MASALNPAREKQRKRSGLFFDAEDLPRIRKTLKHPRFAAFWKGLIEADLTADRTFLEKELHLNNHVKDFLRAREILERTSFVYAVTQDSRQLEVAKRAI